MHPTGPSRAIDAVLSENCAVLPPQWTGSSGRPNRTGRREAFWACTAAIIAEGLTGALPAEVRAGPRKIALRLSRRAADALRRELGLARPEHQQVVSTVIRAVIDRRPARLADPDHALTDLLEPRTVALLLLTELLAIAARERRGFALDAHAIATYEQPRLAGVVVGPLDHEPALGRLFERAATRMEMGGELLRPPYHDYWRSLLGHVSAIEKADPQRPAPEPSADFLLKGLARLESGRSQPERARPDTPPVRPRPPEAQQLRRTLDALQASHPGDALVRLLEPLLALPGEPAGHLEGTVDGTTGIVRDLLLAMIGLLRSSDIELFGRPSEVLELDLPARDYRLEGVVPRRKHGSNPRRYRLGRRGVRYRGIVLRPALVAPVLDEPNDRKGGRHR